MAPPSSGQSHTFSTQQNGKKIRKKVKVSKFANIRHQNTEH